MMSSNTVSTRLTDEELAKLEQLAKGAGVTKAMALRLLVLAADVVGPPTLVRLPIVRKAHVTWKSESHE